MDTISPREQKAIGRSVKGTNGPEWDEGDIHRWGMIARDAILVGSIAKYLHSEKHMNALMGTTGKFLVEASPYDTIWGIGMRDSDPGVEDPKNWKGTNWLGICLTEAREIFTEATVEEMDYLRRNLAGIG